LVAHSAMALLKDLPFYQASGQGTHSSTNLLAYPTALDLPAAKLIDSPDRKDGGRVSVGINRKLFRKLQRKNSNSESVCRASPSSTEDDVKVGDVVEAAVPAGDGTNDGSLSRCLDDAPSDQM